MEKLNKDELFSLALHLDLPNLLNLCSSNIFKITYVKEKKYGYIN